MARPDRTGDVTAGNEEGGSVTLIDLHRVRHEAEVGHGRTRARKELLYERVIELIERIVVEQSLVPGDLLPTQAELCELAGVSRITVTRALEELERTGRVTRHQGVGTFLARPRYVSEPAKRGGLLGTLEASGAPIRVGTRVLGLERGVPSPDLAMTLGVAPGALVWRLYRQRVLEGRPMVVESSVIPVALAPDLDRHADALAGSLYELLERRYDLRDAAEEQYLEVVAPSDEHRRLLDVSSRARIVRIRGLSIDQRGRPFDCFEQVYPASNFAFYLSPGASRQLLVAAGERDWSVAPAPVEPIGTTARRPARRARAPISRTATTTTREKTQ
ncbi:MAG TPA: GntR family transcriptional regulator [Acidimicrobiales bacterium]|nr:GntR family transcriptional regulator [Acidimicrobiales bacterium]